jgi:hypothetical protein
VQLIKRFTRLAGDEGFFTALGHGIGALVARFTVKHYGFFEKMGIHVIPVHYYEPIPDRKELKTREDLWKNESRLPGIDMKETGQVELLNKVFPAYSEEYRFPKLKTKDPVEYYLGNGNFGPIDAEVTHCMIRHFLPEKVIEVGSGNSTRLMARACLLNKERSGKETKLYTLDPYPDEVLSKGIPGLAGLTIEKAENMPLDFFLKLNGGDILFIDSSHVVQTGNDVNYLFLEVLPRLKPGIVIHVHDIFLPREYPKQWMYKLQRFCSEQYLVQAFLAYNCAFEVLFSNSYMHLRHQQELKAVFPSYDGTDWPSSFWMKKIA